MYAITPMLTMSLSDSTHQVAKIEVVMAAVASTPRPRTHSASTHWNDRRRTCDANSGAASLSSARGIGWVRSVFGGEAWVTVASAGRAGMAERPRGGASLGACRREGQPRGP